MNHQKRRREDADEKECPDTQRQECSMHRDADPQHIAAIIFLNNKAIEDEACKSRFLNLEV